MSEIPEDVVVAAHKAIEHLKSPIWHYDAGKAVESAILAERKRCARIAMSNAHTDCEVAEQIASQIEAGA